MTLAAHSFTADQIADHLARYIDGEVARLGLGEAPELPSPRAPFHWPPHASSADFHVMHSDWTGDAEVKVQGECFGVKVAKTPYGYFGRVEELWAEARGPSREEMLERLAASIEPLLTRQAVIARTLGREGRYDKPIRDLPPVSLVMLLYCPDRDVSHTALTEIEAHASLQLFGPALMLILRDRRHPYRRNAQWAALDLLEDMPSFWPLDQEHRAGVGAIRDLMWDAEDDYARAIYKAGVVLGGHACTDVAADALLECFDAPSKIGRRSATHAGFHLCEWRPDRRDQVVRELWRLSQSDPEPALRAFCAALIPDIERGEVDHVTEPTFPDEPPWLRHGPTASRSFARQRGGATSGR
jgi:hypothetical protein